MRVLLVGGAGHVASIMRDALAAAHDVRYYDLRPVPGAADRTFVGDVQDEPLLRHAMIGQDVVIWSAMGVQPGTSRHAHMLDACFDVNIKGLYRTLAAAGRTGVRRFIYLSSMSVYGHFASADHVPITEDHEPDEWHRYGMSKWLGEKMGEQFVKRYPQATFLSLRLIRPCNEEEFKTRAYHPGDLHCCIGPQDTRRLMLAAVQFERPGVYHVNVSGDLDGRTYPNTRVHQLIGWQPQGN